MAEAEYLALSGASGECLWLRQLTTELDSKPLGPTTKQQLPKPRNLNTMDGKIYIHTTLFMNKLAIKGTLKIKYCRTSETIADMTTKGLNREQFVKLRTNAGL